MSATDCHLQLVCRWLPTYQGNPWFEKMEHRAGIEPASIGFADRRVNRFATGAHWALTVETHPRLEVWGELVNVNLHRVDPAGEGIQTLAIAADG